jgi:hypothetical protein
MYLAAFGSQSLIVPPSSPGGGAASPKLPLDPLPPEEELLDPPELLLLDVEPLPELPPEELLVPSWNPEPFGDPQARPVSATAAQSKGRWVREL